MGIKSLNKVLTISVLMFFILNCKKVKGQCDNPPFGDGCRCWNAPVLCTPDELNGFTFSMSSNSNHGGFGFGNDLCPGNGDQGGVPNNVNFFSFIAWCEDLTFDVLVSNCLDNPNDGMQSFGIQMALFAGCGNFGGGFDPIECFTNGDNYCHNAAADVPAVQTFNMNGLTIGNVYYFMLDGCARSTCDIEIVVVNTCGTGMIDDWTTGIEGDQDVCTGIPYTYTTEDLDGAVEYYYYIDGTFIEAGEEQTEFIHTWDTPGTYELCVDVSNLPCIEESEDPGQNCITINVIDINAGDITATPQPICPGEDITVTVANYAMDATNGLILYIVNEDGIIEQVVMGDNTTVNHDMCETWMAFSYSYILADDPTLQNIGDAWQDIDCTDECCEVVSISFEWSDTEQPVFTDNPASATLMCADEVMPAVDLAFTDNCLPDGDAVPVTVEDFTLCDGGTVTHTWTVIDLCENEISYTQTLTIEPLPEAVWIDAPAASMVDCENKPTAFPDLQLTNSASGDCSIDEMISPTVQDDADVCGGDITLTWSFTDVCGRPYEHIQIITVEPAPVPVMADMPGDITLACGDALPPAEPILVTNGAMGDCLLEELVIPVVVDNTSACDGTATYTWTYTDDCDNSISHTQTITITPPLEAVFISVPADMMLMCSEIPTATVDLVIDNGLTGPCQILDDVTPTVEDNSSECGGTIIYTWTFTDFCDRTVVAMQTLTIEPAPEGMFIDVPANITIDCGDTAGDPVDLMFTNAAMDGCLIEDTVSPTTDGAVDPCGADITYTWTFTDDCDRTQTATQVVTVNPAPEAVWIDPPAPIMVDCSSFDANAPTLAYTNSASGDCEIADEVAGTVLGTLSPCGEDMMYMWTFTDDCDRTIDYTQNIEVAEADLPTFDDMPADITLTCDEVPATPPSLTYSNGSTGDCERAGTVQAVQSGSFDACGGLIIYTWTATDLCGYTFNLTQTITVLAAAPPVFIDPPMDVTLTCDEIAPEPSELFYENEAVTACLIMGSVPPVVTVDGLVTTFTWTFTTPCDPPVTIEHIQNITQSTTPDIVINPTSIIICEGDFFDLSTVNVTDNNGGMLTIEYLDDQGNVLNSPIVIPESTTTYTIRIYNEFDCTDEAIFTVIVDEKPLTGNGSQGNICVGSDPINLFAYIIGPNSMDGTWTDLSGLGINVDDPFFVNISNLEPGSYEFLYTVPSGNICPDESTTVFIEIVTAPTLSIIDVSCDNTNTTYSVTLIPSGGDVSSDIGTVTTFPDGSVVISDIDINSNVNITVEDFGTMCEDEINISPPDCDCPLVDPPTAVPVDAICVGDANPELTVEVPNGFTANWYDDSNGTNIVATMSLAFTPTDTAPGIYSYYVESVDANGCISNVKTEVTYEIIAPPTANNVTLTECKSSDGSITIVLSDINSLVNTNTSFTYEYFMSMADAIAGNGVITDIEINTSNVLKLYTRVTSNQGCIAIAEVTITPLDLPMFQLAATDITCVGNDDGTITITNIGDPSTLFDLQDTIYTADLVYQGLSSGNYTVNAKSGNGCVASETEIIAEGDELLLSSIVVICSDNDTDTNPADDFYTITLEINTDPSTVTIMDENNNSVAITSTSPLTIQLPADENITNINLTVTGGPNSCSATLETGALTPCSTDCSFDVSPIVPVCNDNGTTTNPDDDFYTIAINADPVNGTSSIYRVLADGMVVGTFAYDVDGNITIPASDTPVTLTIVDNDDSQCFVTEILDDLSPCSNDCIIDLGLPMIDCDNNETAGVTDDDQYNISFVITGTNPPSDMANVFIDDVLQSTHNYGETVELNIAASENTITIRVADSNDETCAEEFDVELTPCSGECMLTTIVAPSMCNNNDTADDESDDTFTAEVTINIADGSGEWTIMELGTNGTSGETITVGPFPISGGDQVLNISDTSISSCSETITISAPQPCSSCEGEVEAGPDVTLTCSQSMATLTGTSTLSGTAYWLDPAEQILMGETITVATTGTYYFNVDQGQNCIITDSLMIDNDDSVPTVSAGPDLIFDCDTDSLIITGTVTGGTGNFSYSWTDEDGNEISTNESLTVFQPGVYALQVTDATTGCMSPSDLVLIEDRISGPAAVIYTDPGDILDCVIEIIYLSSDEADAVSYEWIINGEAADIENLSITEPSEIMLVATDTITGCDNTDLLSIPNLQEYPLINIEPVVDLDCEIVTVTIDATASQSGANISSTWYNTNGEILLSDSYELDVTESGSYILELIDSENGCTNSDTVEVANIGAFPDITLQQTLEIDCDETSIDITAAIASQGGTLSILWTSNGGNILSDNSSEIITVDGPGEYTIAVTDNQNSCSTESTITVIYPDLISDVALTLWDENCEDNNDGAATIDLVSGGTPPYQYFLDGDEIEENLQGLTSGTYALQVVDDNNCTLDTTFNISTLPAFGVRLPADIDVTTGDQSTLTLSIDIPTEEVAEISWSPIGLLDCDTCTTVTYKATETTTFDVTVIDIYGCEAVASITITVSDEVDILFPNIFNPSGEVNTKFFPTSNDESAIVNKISIFDRWGNKVFSNENFAVNTPTEGWDGYYKGNQVQQGVFVFYAEILFADGSTKSVSADITVLWK